MEIRVNEDSRKVEVELDRDDLERFGIEVDMIRKGSIMNETELLGELLKEIEKDADIELTCKPLMLEFRVMENRKGDVMVYITVNIMEQSSAEDIEEENNNDSKDDKKDGVQHKIVVEFDGYDTLKAFSSLIVNKDRMESQLYKLNGRLVMFIDYSSSFATRIEAVANEYGYVRRGSAELARAYMYEHGKLLIKSGALEVMSKL